MICSACGIILKKDEDKWFQVEWKMKPDDKTTIEILCDPCIDKMIARDDVSDFMVTECYDDQNKEVIANDM